MGSVFKMAAGLSLTHTHTHTQRHTHTDGILKLIYEPMAPLQVKMKTAA